MTPRSTLLACLALIIGQYAVAAPAPLRYDVFLTPGPQLRPIMTSLSERLERRGLTALYTAGYLPHVTLYLTEYPPGSLPELEARVRAIAARQRSFPMHLGRLVVTPSHWMLLQVAASTPMRRLADAVTRALAPLRTPNPAMPAWVRAYPDKQAVFRRYGSPNVFDQFQPHLTVLAHGAPARLARFMDTIGSSDIGGEMQATGIGIARANADGQARRMLVRFPFAPHN